jgi:prepilin-type N-terminal cleavage/methylation domain-containing protein
MKYTNLKKNLKAGFSLVEMLVVIAVIGVIAAIAIPNIGNVNAAAKNARDQRNAQSVASVHASGSAAGVAWVATSASAAVDDVITGRAASDGAFSGKIFRCPLPGISSTDLTALKTHLSLSTDGQLVYTP